MYPSHIPAAPQASLVVPTLNASRMLRRLLICLAEQTARARFEIIVVDNGSSDDTVAVAEAHADVVLSISGGNGSTAARNLGLARASTPFLLSTDADCVPCKRDWAAVLLSALAGQPSDVLAVAGPLLPFPSPNFWAMRSDITPHPQFLSDRSPAYAVNGSACYRTDVLRELGGYPNVAANDAGIGRAARARGFRFHWVPEGAVYHENLPGVRAYLRQRRKHGAYTAELTLSGSERSRYFEAARHVAAGVRPLGHLQFREAAAQTLGGLATHIGSAQVARAKRTRS